MIKAFLIILLVTGACANQGQAQPNPFAGGNGSGYQAALSPAGDCQLFSGGLSSGAISYLSALTVCPSFLGGIADGSDSHASALTICPPFLGGNGDGHAQNNSICSIILPAKLLSFSGEKDGQRNLLHWKVIDGYNVRFFDIEKSADAVNFIHAGTAAGSTDYNHPFLFIDNAPYPGTSFYRLRITEMDNSISYSNIVPIRDQYSPAVIVYPNPTAGSATLYYYARQAGVTSIRVLQLDGRLVLSQQLNLARGANFLQLNLASFANGVYVLKLNDEPGLRLLVGK
jgi:hypothetical protein